MYHFEMIIHNLEEQIFNVRFTKYPNENIYAAVIYAKTNIYTSIVISIAIDVNGNAQLASLYVAKTEADEDSKYNDEVEMRIESRQLHRIWVSTDQSTKFHLRSYRMQWKVGQFTLDNKYFFYVIQNDYIQKIEFVYTV